MKIFSLPLRILLVPVKLIVLILVGLFYAMPIMFIWFCAFSICEAEWADNLVDRYLPDIEKILFWGCPYREDN
jgi:hypothetical protein